MNEQIPGGTIPSLVDADRRDRRLAANTPVPCRYGHTWCDGGPTEHQACTGPLTTCFLPGYEHPVPVLDAQLADWCDGKGIVISLSSDGHTGTSVTSAELRTAIADVREHLDRLAALAEQYDAVLGKAVTE